MPKDKLPPAAGSPFITKNFNKFFFGICIAALILVVLFVLYFLFFAKKHGTPKTATPTTSSVYSSAPGRDRV